MAKKAQLPPPPRVLLRQLMEKAVEVSGEISQQEGGDPKSILLYALGDALGQNLIEEDTWVSGISEPDQFGAVRWKAMEDYLATLPSTVTVPNKPRFFLKETLDTFDNLTEEQKTNISRNIGNSIAAAMAGGALAPISGVWVEVKRLFRKSEWKMVQTLKGWTSVWGGYTKEQALEKVKPLIEYRVRFNRKLEDIFSFPNA